MKVVDMHCDTLSRLENHKETNLRDNNFNISVNKMIKGDYLLQNFAIFTPLNTCDNPVTHVNRLIDRFYLEVENNPELKAIYRYDDIDFNYINAMLTLEEGAVVCNDLAYLRNYYRLGVRMVTLTWNFENGIGYPNFDMDDSNHGFHTYDDVHGLSEFGIEYVKECERLGIIIDVSHLSDAGFYDVLKYTTKPFVASHSNARAICDHARNMSDDMILKLANRGGVIGINFCDMFLNEDAHYSYVKDMVKHILYIRDLAGIDCIGLGSDFDGIAQVLEIKDASLMSLLYDGLKEAGLSEEDIEKIFYKNVLRLYKEVLV